MSAATIPVEHPPLDPDGFAVEYDCGCVEAWCVSESVAGLFWTDACEKHAQQLAAGEGR